MNNADELRISLESLKEYMAHEGKDLPQHVKEILKEKIAAGEALLERLEEEKRESLN